MMSFTQTLPKKPITQRALFLLGVFFLTSPISTTWATEEENKELKDQQEKLQGILNEIGDLREQRTEQRALLEKLNGKMQCNWTLIQAYDACDKKYKEQKQEQLSCVQKARDEATKCLSDLESDAQ